MPRNDSQRSASPDSRLRPWLCTLAYLVALTGCACSAPDEVPSSGTPALSESGPIATSPPETVPISAEIRPNVVLISIDCLNERQYLAAIRDAKTPALRRLNEDSIRFGRGYSHAPWTNPSHMSMLTGLYPSQHGRDLPFYLMIQANESYDRMPEHPTLPGRLSAEGYETVAFVGMGSISGRYGLNRGFDRYEESKKVVETDSDLVLTSSRMESWFSDRDDRRPFFLFFHTYDLHGPAAHQLVRDNDVLAHIDLHLKRLFALLDERGLYDDALILFTGDHGSKMLHVENKCCVHGVGHYDENLRVPMVVKLPKSVQRGSREGLARHIDLFPTVLDVLQLEEPGYRGEGVSLLKVASGAATTPYSFSEADGRCARRFGLVNDRWKYIYTPNSADQQLLRNSKFVDSPCAGRCEELPALEEIYDLDQDPFENHDVLTIPLTPAVEAVLAEFRVAMRHHLNLPLQYRKRLVGQLEPNDDDLDDELTESLRALGYIE